MTTATPRSRRQQLLISLAGFAIVSTVADAQDSSAARERLGVEFGLGLTTRVQAIADAGLGPVATIAVRHPARKGASGFIAAVSYAFVPLTRRLPDDSPNNSALEGIYGALGMEWKRGTSTHLDLQWNPAIANVRRWGTQPAWRSQTPTQRSFSAVSVGMRLGKPEARVGYALRLHTTVHPLAFLRGTYPSFQVMVRP